MSSLAFSLITALDKYPVGVYLVEENKIPPQGIFCV